MLNVEENTGNETEETGGEIDEDECKHYLIFIIDAATEWTMSL